MTGKITSPILVAQHLRTTFCRKEWLMEHVNTQINEIVVMYLSADKVIRPPAPADVSVCKGIISCFSFLFLGVVRHYAKRPFNCWCKACSRVRGRGVGSQSSRSDLLVSGCTCTKQTSSTEDQFLSSQSQNHQGYGITRTGDPSAGTDVPLLKRES